MGSVNEGLSGNTPWTYSKIILLVILNLTLFDNFKNIGASCGAWNSTTLNLLLTVSHHRHFWWWRCRVFLSSWLEERGLKCIRWSAKSEGALLLQSTDYGHRMRAFLISPIFRPIGQIGHLKSCDFTTNFYPMKTKGTGNYRVPARKTCTIYRKGL